MKLTKLFTVLAGLTLSCAANAVVLTTSTGSNLVTDYSGTGLVSFDLDLADFSGSTLNFVLEEADLQGPLAFNALVRNLAGADLSRFTFSLQGISFTGAPGSVTPSFGTVGRIDASPFATGISFGRPEYAEFQFGNVLGGGQDWLLATSGLRAGDSFSITATVPEPSTAALLLPMLCMAGLMAARRRKQD
ncbi:PEP-CTERM sorting domain-containing protein [Massilia sp. IC2-477]|uniref:PEP-CTERM sorting domain-containing protein n=1 Tax=Massilia sp. IC2-477 TaxID=2887198 RepID=UPI001D11AE1A|nr:PEP-CTERM sorting domain-containing protein [Massilia sp. IC2-477]MCC2954023.1 PEP-CTERM sorting domain-containing protein [Massilia sp. IC2-477]